MQPFTPSIKNTRSKIVLISNYIGEQYILFHKILSYFGADINLLATIEYGLGKYRF